MYNHNKAQQSKNCVHISWDILYFMGTGEILLECPSASEKNLSDLYRMNQ